MIGTSRAWLIGSLPMLAMAQVLAGSFHELTGWGVSIPDRSASTETAAIPAAYTFFVIWGVIFLGCLVFSVYQALPSQRDNTLLERLRGPAASSFLINTLWQINAQLNSLAWVSFGIIVILLAACLAGVEQVNRDPAPIRRRDFWLAVIPLHVLAGWISVAAFAHLSSSLLVTGLLSRDDPATGLVVVLLLSAATVGAGVTMKARVPAPYALAVAWGLAGVVVANIIRLPNTAIAMAAALGTTVVLGSLLVRSRAQPGVSQLARPLA